MSQVNIKHGGGKATETGYSGYGFNAQGQPIIVDDQGQPTILQTGNSSPSNVIANKGIGIEADLPSSGFSQGDTYVTNDTFKIYVANDSVSWGSTDLVKGQQITDVSVKIILPPVFQFYNNNLMPIANYVVELPDLPPM